MCSRITTARGTSRSRSACAFSPRRLTVGLLSLQHTNAGPLTSAARRLRIRNRLMGMATPATSEKAWLLPCSSVFALRWLEAPIQQQPPTIPEVFSSLSAPAWPVSCSTTASRASLRRIPRCAATEILTMSRREITQHLSSALGRLAMATFNGEHRLCPIRQAGEQHEQRGPRRLGARVHANTTRPHVHRFERRQIALLPAHEGSQRNTPHWVRE